MTKFPYTPDWDERDLLGYMMADAILGYWSYDVRRDGYFVSGWLTRSIRLHDTLNDAVWLDIAAISLGTDEFLGFGEFGDISL